MKNTVKFLTVAAITTVTLCFTTIPHTNHLPKDIPTITEHLEDTDIVGSTPNYGIALLSDWEDDYKNE